MGQILVIIFVVYYVVSAAVTDIQLINQVSDAWKHGLPPLREGYIPPSKRKVEGVMFVPKGGNPKDYILP